jgi:peptidyl-prolyl cis-trans isomerase SurA
MPVLVGAALCASVPLKAQNMAAAEPAVPNVPRAVTPDSVAAAPKESPDASRIDASDGKATAEPSLDLGDGKTLDTAPIGSSNQDADGIAATVNDEPISDFELSQRMGLIAATTLNMKLSQMKPEDLKRLRGQILGQLEDEKIRLQEAAKKHITVSPTEVDKQINRLVEENHLTLEQLRTILSDAGSNIDALRAEMTAQIAWQKAVQQEYGDRINITPADIDAEMLRAADGANKPHFLVAEIFLPVDNSDQDARVQKDAQDLETQLQQGAQFGTLARQFSQSPTAAQGGDLGWVHEGQLAPELNTALSTMKVGTLSHPVRSVGGYYLLALRARQEPLGTQIAQVPTASVNPTGTLKLARLLLPLDAASSKDSVQNAMKIAGQIRASYDGCEKLAQLPKQIEGSVFYDMGEMKLTDLSPDLQKGLATTKPGEMAPPMMSDAGIELIGRCDARIEERTAFTLPTRQQVESQLFDDQISALGRRYMRDLKRDADVEVR